MFLSAFIDTEEKRKVMTLDIPGAFMQADIGEIVHMRFEREYVDLSNKIDPKLYSPCMVVENGKGVILNSRRHFHGTQQILLWRELSTFLIAVLGF